MPQPKGKTTKKYVPPKSRQTVAQNIRQTMRMALKDPSIDLSPYVRALNKGMKHPSKTTTTYRIRKGGKMVNVSKKEYDARQKK